MNTQEKDLLNQPNPARLIFGLRDTGYDSCMAAADIIDNSIAANASNVHIRVVLETNGAKRVYFGDDGDGMDRRDLINALKYGANERTDLASLGKFGLGLKTASSSVCKEYFLISRKEKFAHLAKLGWNLDHVAQIGQWEMTDEEVSTDEREVFAELCGDTGTLLVWRSCDRLLNREFHEPGGSAEKRAVSDFTTKLKSHIGMIFHRFLDHSDDRAKDVTITVNNEIVEPWNPFVPELADVLLESHTIELEGKGGVLDTCRVKAWHLRHKNFCNDEEAKKIKHATKRQGFYVFRENRLIEYGSWLGIGNWGTLEPHMSLLRIEFDFGNILDDSFRVDVRKSRIILDPALEDYIEKLITPVRRESERRTRASSKSKLKEKGGAVAHDISNNSLDKDRSKKQPILIDVDSEARSAIISNERGPKIKLRIPIENDVDPRRLHVEAVDTITSGDLWEPALRSASSINHQFAVRLNKNHDFYQKIYLRAIDYPHQVHGMDLLLWALSTAEQQYVNEELQTLFEDLRNEVSNNLRKLLRDVDLPEISDDDDIN